MAANRSLQTQATPPGSPQRRLAQGTPSMRRVVQAIAVRVSAASWPISRGPTIPLTPWPALATNPQIIPGALIKQAAAGLAAPEQRPVPPAPVMDLAAVAQRV